MKSFIITLLGVLFLGAGIIPIAHAEEGMWTFDNFPSKKVQAEYKFNPSQAWLDHVRASSLRIAGGCSASFISPSGLVMTNHHCVVECVQQLSTAKQDFSRSGFSANTQVEEQKCPDFELDQLTQIRDVTTEVHAATADKTGDAANKALHAEEAKLEQSCGSDPAVLCEVVSLYHGGVYDLYRYNRYTDVRLVFAPEFSVAQMGGDPDNFNFPRFDFDIGLLRAYRHDKPVSTPDYLHWSENGSKDGELVFVSGNPGSTSRELTIAQLDFLRDISFPEVLPFLAEYRGQLEQFMTEGPEQKREANEQEFLIANAYKAEFGEDQALLDHPFFESKIREEQHLRAAVKANPKLTADVSAWDDIAKTEDVRAKLFLRASDLNSYLLHTGLLGDAIRLVRAASERTKPNGERLPGYTDQGLIRVQSEISAPVPVYRDFEELNLAYIFTIIQRDLGNDDPFVQKMLGNESPEQLAHRLVTNTHLDDAKVRVALFDGGEAAVSTSTDPLIRFVATIDPDLRAARKEYEDQIEAPTRAAAERIAKARFAIYGTTVYPDATFTPRLNYGTVKGFNNAQGHFVESYTTIGGLFHHATGAPPYDLPESWLKAKSFLDMDTPMNLSTTNDVVGGNSGSPLINEKAEIVGLVFDGNIFSLGGDYGYDAAKNRTVSVDSRALLEGLSKVYHLDRIVQEIQSAK